MSSLLRLERQQERFLKIHFELDLYLFSDQNGAKTVSFGDGGVQTFMAYTREYPPGSFVAEITAAWKLWGQRCGTGQEDFPSNYPRVYFV